SSLEVTVGRFGTALDACLHRYSGIADCLAEIATSMRNFTIAIALALSHSGQSLLYPMPPTPQSAEYVVHIPGLRVTEMSPDEQSLAVIVAHWPKGLPPTAQVQIWNFRKGNLIESRSLPAPERRPGYPHGTTHLHYTSDGRLLIAYIGGNSLHVLRLPD